MLFFFSFSFWNPAHLTETGISLGAESLRTGTLDPGVRVLAKLVASSTIVATTFQRFL